MYDFIFQIIIMLALTLMIYLAARALPRVSELPAQPSKRDYVGEIIKQIPFEKIDAFLNALAAKLLRKAKVFVLKIDNLISRYLNQLRTNGNGKEHFKPDLFKNDQNQ
jgi:hypothetical protein